MASGHFRSVAGWSYYRAILTTRPERLEQKISFARAKRGLVRGKRRETSQDDSATRLPANHTSTSAAAATADNSIHASLTDIAKAARSTIGRT